MGTKSAKKMTPQVDAASAPRPPKGTAKQKRKSKASNPRSGIVMEDGIVRIDVGMKDLGKML